MHTFGMVASQARVPGGNLEVHIRHSDQSQATFECVRTIWRWVMQDTPVRVKVGTPFALAGGRNNGLLKIRCGLSVQFVW